MISFTYPCQANEATFIHSEEKVAMQAGQAQQASISCRHCECSYNSYKLAKWNRLEGVNDGWKDVLLPFHHWELRLASYRLKKLVDSSCWSKAISSYWQLLKWNVVLHFTNAWVDINQSTIQHIMNINMTTLTILVFCLSCTLVLKKMCMNFNWIMPTANILLPPLEKWRSVVPSLLLCVK